MFSKSIPLISGWNSILAKELNQPYISKIFQKIHNEIEMGIIIYPPTELIFNAFNLTPYKETKVVIIGQDPYHGAQQAHGLAFSVPDGTKPTPSLINIFKELNKDVLFKIPDHGNLVSWARQGVLLMNSSLTVRANQAGSHSNIGWENFTDFAIKTLNKKTTPIVFVLWGKSAHKKERLINNRHLVLKAAHPSPLSAYRGFFGCRHFSKINTFLSENNHPCIQWQI